MERDMAKDKIECSEKDGCPMLRKAIKGLWNKITGTVLVLIVAFGGGTYLFGADIINLIKEAPTQKEDIKILKEFAVSTKERLIAYEKEQERQQKFEEQNKKDNETIIALLKDIKRDKEAETQ